METYSKDKSNDNQHKQHRKVYYTKSDENDQEEQKTSEKKGYYHKKPYGVRRPYHKDRGARREYTHFLSIPLQTQGVQQHYNKWKESIVSQSYDGIFPSAFTSSKLIHLTLCMLPLADQGQLEKAQAALESVEDIIKQAIQERGVGGKLAIDFDGLGIFGEPTNTKVMFMKLKEGHDYYQLLRDIIHVLVQAMLDNNVIEEKELSFIKMNKTTNRWENEQLHITLLNSKFAKRDLQKYNMWNIDGTEIINNHMEGFKFELALPATIELSKRGEYSQNGFYKCEYAINL